MAGALTAIGLVGVGRMNGILWSLLLFAGLWFFFSATLFGVLSELGITVRRAVAIGRGASLGVMALVGLVLLLPVVGWFAAGTCALTCPPVVARTQRALHRARGRFGRRPAAVPVRQPPAPDQAAVDEEFERIVTDLHWHDD